jgi:hypothetical protein
MSSSFKYLTKKNETSSKRFEVEKIRNFFNRYSKLLLKRKKLISDFLEVL